MSVIENLLSFLICNHTEQQQLKAKIDQLISVKKDVLTQLQYKEDSGDTLLHYACTNSHLNIVQYLISEVHCNPSCEDCSDNTPLHHACINPPAKITDILTSSKRAF